jgi:hypothetical protein
MGIFFLACDGLEERNVHSATCSHSTHAGFECGDVFRITDERSDQIVEVYIRNVFACLLPLLGNVTHRQQLGDRQKVMMIITRR